MKRELHTITVRDAETSEHVGTRTKRTGYISVARGLAHYMGRQHRAPILYTLIVNGEVIESEKFNPTQEGGTKA